MTIDQKELLKWEEVFLRYLEANPLSDKSHDVGHFKRVWKTARTLVTQGEDLLIILAAAFFHDIVSYPKDDHQRDLSSIHAAAKTEKILRELDFPRDKIARVKHCIEAHSFSAKIAPKTDEAKIIQDADRIEALGAIGLARTFYVAGRLGSKLFHEKDPFAENRVLDDNKYALDHFQIKLLGLAQTMQTVAGRVLAHQKTEILLRYLKDLRDELV